MSKLKLVRLWTLRMLFCLSSLLILAFGSERKAESLWQKAMLIDERMRENLNGRAL